MEIVVREAQWADLEQIIRVCQPRGASLSEFQHYRGQYFTATGEHRHFLTSYPDEVLVAELNGRIVGYLHFYTDCWEGYEKVLVSLGVDLALSAEDAKAARGKLETEFRLREP